MVKFETTEVGGREVTYIDPCSIPKEDFKKAIHWSLGELKMVCVKDDYGCIHLVIKSLELDRMVQAVIDDDPFKIVDQTINMLSALEAQKQRIAQEDKSSATSNPN